MLTADEKQTNLDDQPLSTRFFVCLTALPAGLTSAFGRTGGQDFNHFWKKTAGFQNSFWQCLRQSNTRR